MVAPWTSNKIMISKDQKKSTIRLVAVSGSFLKREMRSRTIDAKSTSDGASQRSKKRQVRIAANSIPAKSEEMRTPLRSSKNVVSSTFAVKIFTVSVHLLCTSAVRNPANLGFSFRSLARESGAGFEPCERLMRRGVQDLLIVPLGYHACGG